MIYNPLDKFYKSFIGAIPDNQVITFRVKGQFDSVVFVLRKDGQSDCARFVMQKNDDYFEIQLKIERGLYFYCFDISNGKFIGKSKYHVGVISNDPKWFQLTSYDHSYSVPDWIYGGVIYQIFPDRFYSYDKQKIASNGKVLHESWDETPVYLPNEKGKIINNDFFGGDIKGIIEKLDYLSSLGVTVIYLNPIFKAYSNHRYDTGDYMQIDSLLGSEEDFISLIKTAGNKGIKIILDGVFNHTGDDSLYFNKYGNYISVGAYQSKSSPYYEWYNFTQFPDKYESWWGIETLPQTNETNEGFVDYITGKDGVLEHYTKLGVGGWRLDVVDELPTEFVRKIRSAIKNVNADGIVIGEVWEDVSNKISYGKRREYFQGYELDSAMNYPLKNAIITFVKYGNSKELSNVIKEQLDHYPHVALNAMMNIISTHDTMRLLTAVGGQDASRMSKVQMAETVISDDNIRDAKFKLKVASLLQFTLCGVPSIYYGDEAGMQGYADPLNRKTYPWGKEDIEIIEWYKFLGQLRKDYSAFTKGEFIEVFSSNGAYAFIRKDEKSELLVVVNVSDKDLNIEFDGELYELIKNDEIVNGFELKARDCAVIIKK